MANKDNSRRHSFAHITTPSNSLDVVCSLRAARSMEREGLVTYDGKVDHDTSREHLFTPKPGKRRALNRKIEEVGAY
jgi:hypothetical protein